MNIDLHCPSPHCHPKGIKMNIHKKLKFFSDYSRTGTNSYIIWAPRRNILKGRNIEEFTLLRFSQPLGIAKCWLCSGPNNIQFGRFMGQSVVSGDHWKISSQSPLLIWNTVLKYVWKYYWINQLNLNFWTSVSPVDPNSNCNTSLEVSGNSSVKKHLWKAKAALSVRSRAHFSLLLLTQQLLSCSRISEFSMNIFHSHIGSCSAWVSRQHTEPVTSLDQEDNTQVMQISYYQALCSHNKQLIKIFYSKKESAE